ncbi:2'-5' RNA ligase family protein [Spongiactinospora gelatinilytica]|nr:2'-5' RNA ligase family protein [Spongiactinospora gelatinilytica]
MYAWHATFGDQIELHALTERYQEAFGSLSGVDAIPQPWLHLTMQGVAFTDEVSARDLAEIVTRAQKRLRSAGAVTFKVYVPIVDPEAIMFRPDRTDRLRQFRDEVREAIADVWGANRVPETPEWAPHISSAYSNATGPASPFFDAIASVKAGPASVTLREIQLIRLGRDTRLYTWETAASVPLDA